VKIYNTYEKTLLQELKYNETASFVRSGNVLRCLSWVWDVTGNLAVVVTFWKQNTLSAIQKLGYWM
jgi:hypothetical protein